MDSANINKWFAIYVNSRCEKKVYKELCDRNIMAYLPLQKVMRQWSDRKKLVAVPLIKSYVFVNVNNTLYDEVLKIPGVVRYICFSGKAVAIPDKQINYLKTVLEFGEKIEVIKSLPIVGETITINSGSFKGYIGTVVDEKKFKFVVQLEQIGFNVLVTVPISYIR